MASDAQGARLVLVPTNAFDALGDDALATFGTAVGRACGTRVAARLGGAASVRGGSLEVVISHLAGELALAGACSLEIERWGRAMLAVVKNEAVAKDAFSCALLSSAIGEAAGRAVFAVSVGREVSVSRFFIGSRETTERVRDLVAGGRSYGDVVATLQGSAS